MSYKIGVDISGGDHAPGEIFRGCLLARKEFDAKLVLIGVKQEIEKEAAQNKVSLDEFTIIDAPEKIEMGDFPATAIRKKKKSSIVVGMEMMRNKQIDAFVSCGNTGAAVCGATLILGLINGVERPGIALTIPTRKGVSLIMDVGANVDPKPMHYLQYGIMAAEYYNAVLGKDKPTVGLLNIGEEETKGSETIKFMHKVFANTPLNFIGNLEAKQIFSGNCDCIICDGFMGNIALKVTESCAEFIGKTLIEVIKKDVLGKLGLLLLQGSLRKFKKMLDYAEYGGALLLGVDGVVIIGHGRSNALAVKNAIKVAYNELNHDLNAMIERKVNEVCEDSRVRQIFAA